MASITLDTPTGEHYGAPNNLNTGLQYFSQTEDLNMQDYLDQQALLFSHAGSATANQAFESLMIDQQPPPLYGLENQNSFCNSSATPLERLFEGIDADFSACYPWFDCDTFPKV